MPSEANPFGRRFEFASQVLVIYSIVVFYMEAELAGPGQVRAASGFWLWNERLVLSLFSLEYLFRWSRAQDRLRYPLSPLAIIDLLVIVPAFVGLSMNVRTLRIVRILPLLWMFKLYRYNRALQTVLSAFEKVKRELAVVGFAAALVLLFSAVALHELERHAQPERFGQLSGALWWSLVTMTTVGYGDYYPVTAAGRLVAGATMIVGIGILGTFFSLLSSALLANMRSGSNASDAPHLQSLPPAIPLPEDLFWPRRRAG